MKAIISDKYGSPDVVYLKDVAKPIPNANEVLVKIHAASVNAADLESIKGEFVIRMVAPFKPQHKIPGTDIAGRIEAVGRNIKLFQPGDEIWGDLSFPLRHGTFAEYVCIPEGSLRRKPSSMSFEEAAATPTAAVVALQNLLGKRPLQAGQKILINGAGGGVGTFAIQIAKHYGASVTAVDSTEKLDMLRSIGADHVIDYTQEDFTKNEQQYDLILDVVVQRSIFDYRRVLSQKGVVVMVGGSLSRVGLNMLLGLLVFRNKNQQISIVNWEPNKAEDLDTIQELFDANKVKPIIDKQYPLSEAREALWYLKNGYAKGKVIITM